MKITFLGGADEVGASSLLLEISGKRILVDCGIRPSPKARGGLAGDQLPNLEQITAIDAVLVTHAHTDHTGALELITGRFPEVPVYATAATIALTRVLHQDSRRIMQSRLDEEGELPLFDDIAVQRLMSAFVAVPFKTRLALADGLAVTFFPAGHIAGAAMLGLESDEGNLLITGDISISAQRTVDGARPPAFRPDILIIESTYGGRLHANRMVQERKLVERVAKVSAEGGKVLIPAFALGRAQEILLVLDEFQRRGELPAVPVWADGMVRAICQAYTSFADVLPLPLQERGAKFFQGQIRAIQTIDQRNALVWQPGAAVIVSSSGMLAGGPSLSYARALAGSPQHAILLTGYQDEESPGRRLQELAERGSGSIWLGKNKVDVQCSLGTYSLSAHADEAQLISLTEALNPEHVLLVHGDEPARSSLEKALTQRGRIVQLPRSGQTLQFQLEARKLASSRGQAQELRIQSNLLMHQRQAKMKAFAGSVGNWLLLKASPPTPVRCLGLDDDHLWVEIAPGLEQAAYPEDILADFGQTLPLAADLAPYQPIPTTQAALEPNQALAVANQSFPAEARLRKSGYHLNEHVLVLTFDFPDAALQSYAAEIAALQTATGWQVQVHPEPNQNALNALVRAVLPEGWQIVKGPAIHREQKRLTASVNAPQFSEIQDICSQFHLISGYELELSLAIQPAPRQIPAPATGKPWEINAAYTAIQTALQGSTLYRTSLKGDEIVLSFISQQVGQRYQEQITALARQVGWRLSINPQPNQGAIVEIARSLLAGAGWVAAKGPGIYLEKAEATVTLANSPTDDEIQELTSVFEQQTGFQLLVTPASRPAIATIQVSMPDRVEIPRSRISLRPYQLSTAIDPVKLEKAIERARRMGISPPIQVRRAGGGYLLIDGLYRLRAAEALGLERIPAIVV